MAQLNPEVRGLTSDSRSVEAGDVFAALPGSRVDGRDFIPAAIKRGAVAVLAPADTGVAEDNRNVPFILDENPRRRLARMAARFHGRQPRTVAAVTGTNGKTSVASFTQQIWAALGYRAASLGTLGLQGPGLDIEAGLTTPCPIELHEMLAALVDDGFDHLALEASSHGLSQCRLDGVRVSAAGFTNLTRDHLDYHGSLGDYFAAKARLFDVVLMPGGYAVINADVPERSGLERICRNRGREIITYGRGGEDIRLDAVDALSSGQRVALSVLGQAKEFVLPLVGEFQVMNALCALGLVVAGGADPTLATDALHGLRAVPGRLQLVSHLANGAAIYVDYAHTPGALENVLRALRPHSEGRLVVVFGCGGDRDAGKRPQMGEIASRLADAVIVTDDNPRGEAAAEIRRQIVARCPGAREVGDRSQAIHEAIDGLEAGDVLVIAGKGHERFQTVGSESRPFDDREVALAAALDPGGPE